MSARSEFADMALMSADKTGNTLAIFADTIDKSSNAVMLSTSSDSGAESSPDTALTAAVKASTMRQLTVYLRYCPVRPDLVNRLPVPKWRHLPYLLSQWKQAGLKLQVILT